MILISIKITSIGDVDYVLKIINTFNMRIQNNGIKNSIFIYGYLNLMDECYMLIQSKSTASRFSKKNPKRWFRKYARNIVTWAVLKNKTDWLFYDDFIYRYVLNYEVNTDYKVPQEVISYITKKNIIK